VEGQSEGKHEGSDEYLYDNSDNVSGNAIGSDEHKDTTQFSKTGKYLAESDRTDMTLQTIFGIWDYGDDADDSEFLGSFDASATPSLSNQPDNVTLLDQVEIDLQTVSEHDLRTLSNYTPNWGTIDDTDPDQNPNPGSSDINETIHAGWYFSLIHSSQASPTNEGERVVKDVQIRDGKAIVITAIPNTDACSGGGNSIVHEIDADSGGRLTAAQFDINDDGVIDENDLVTPTDPDSHGLRDAEGNPIDIPPTGKEFTGILYPPVFLTMPDNVREMKLFSTSAGTTETIFEKKEKKQMVYWRIR
jgi:type IV pilus assembly protein PilY1